MARITKGAVQRAQADERRALKVRQKNIDESSRLAIDAYQNFAQSVGIGTQNAMSASTYGFNPITRIRTMLEWMYRGSWIAGVAVDIPAEDMTRSGIEILSSMPPDDIEKLQQGMTRLGVWGGICDTIKWARLYGGCLGVLQIDGQDVSTPLNVDRVGAGAFRGIIPLDRWMVEPDLNDLVTELGPELGNPKFYRVTADAPAFKSKRIHYSRCMRLIGIKLPYWQSIMENLWGLSVYERLYDRLVSFDSATMGMAQNVFRSYIRHYKIDSFQKLMAEGGQAAKALTARMNAMRMTQGNEGVTLLDGKDDVVVSANSSFVGIGEAILKLAEQVSGCLQIPLTRLFGQSPGGLNSTGESDERNYDNGILQKQELDLREPLIKIIRVLARSEKIKIPDNFGFAFNKLTQLTEDQKSQVFARDSVAIADLVNDGLIGPQTGLKELKQLSRATGRMSNISDKEIDEAEELPPPKPEMPLPGAGGLPKPPEGATEPGLEPHKLKGAEDRAVTDDEEFIESQHPRDPDGEFASKGSASAESSSKQQHITTKIENGRRVQMSGRALPNHVLALKIPPAWTDVTYSPDPEASLLATGKDSKGRRQAIYSDQFSAKQAAAKFARISELNEKFGHISDQNEEARKSRDSKKRAAADCTRLIMTTGIRPGSEDDTGAEKKAYGATTLEGRHVIVDGENVRLKFVGKKGVSLDLQVTDEETAAMLRERKRMAGDEGQLFPINEKALLDHVHTLDGGGFKTKDFRTLLGTRTAIAEVDKRAPPKDAASYKKAVMDVAKTVAAKLGNTPVIALQSYINPTVFASWRIAA